MNAVIMADRDVQDRLFLPIDLREAVPNNIPLTTRDGVIHVGRMVFHADTYTAVNVFVANAYTSGQLPDGTPVPANGLLIVDLACRPWAGAPIKFAP